MKVSTVAAAVTETVHDGVFTWMALKTFPASHDMPWHEHSHPCICVVLRGRMFEAIDRRGDAFESSALIYKPPATPHRNVFGRDGATVLTLALRTTDPRTAEGSTKGVTEGITLPDRPLTRRSDRIGRLGQRIADELSSGVADPTSRLLVDALGLELVAEVARLTIRPHRPGPPTWLALIHDRIASEFAESHTISSYAMIAGVHPSYLAKAFRAHYGESIGHHIRRLRIDYASRELSRTLTPISRIALAAGFADQSHFAHAFRKEMGVNPGVYRRGLRSR